MMQLLVLLKQPRRPLCLPCWLQVVGTFISALVFGILTYILVVIGIVRRSHLAGSPFVECLMYGELHRCSERPCACLGAGLLSWFHCLE